jgi:hypothetical protein
MNDELQVTVQMRVREINEITDKVLAPLPIGSAAVFSERLHYSACTAFNHRT